VGAAGDRPRVAVAWAAGGYRECHDRCPFTPPVVR